MINRDLAPAVLHCFVMIYKAERRGRHREAEIWRLGLLALLDTEDRRAA